jgi:hypothetical protein
MAEMISAEMEESITVQRFQIFATHFMLASNDVTDTMRTAYEARLEEQEGMLVELLAKQCLHATEKRRLKESSS